MSFMLPIPMAMAAPMATGPLATADAPAAGLGDLAARSSMARSQDTGITLSRDEPAASFTRLTVEERVAASAASQIARSGIPVAALRAYRRAAETMSIADPSCRLDWALLAGIGRVESDHGRFGGAVLGVDGISSPQIVGVPLDGAGPVAAIADTDAGRLDGDSTWDRAVGPMQFIPSTWVMAGVDGDQDGERNPHDLDDAALAAAAYLCAGDEDLSTAEEAREAVLSYNHSDAYAALVLGVTDAYGAGEFDLAAVPTPGPGLTVGLGDPGRGAEIGGGNQPGKKHDTQPAQADTRPGKHRKTDDEATGGRGNHAQRDGAQRDGADDSTPPRPRGDRGDRGDRATRDTDQPGTPKPDKTKAGNHSGNGPGDTGRDTTNKPDVPPEAPQELVEVQKSGLLDYCDAAAQDALCLDGSTEPLAAEVSAYAHLVGSVVTVIYDSQDDGATLVFNRIEPGQHD